MTDGRVLEIAERVQQQLHKIYEIESEHSVSEFLIADKSLVDTIENGQPGTRDVPEKLLVRQNGEELDLALYVDREVLFRLKDADPTERLTRENLSDFLVLLEGISHFVYLTWNAGRERTVTLLELELQAEVDKFASTLFWLGAQDGGRVPRRLGALLFEGVDFDAQLDDAGLERYETANRLAMKFCAGLEQRFVQRRNVRDLVETLRRFYRLPQEEKLRAAHEPL
jgi:hypothetical protein